MRRAEGDDSKVTVDESVALAGNRSDWHPVTEPAAADRTFGEDLHGERVNDLR